MCDTKLVKINYQTVKLTESFVGEMSQLSIDVIQEELTKTQPAEKRIKDWITSFGHPLESG